MGGEIVFEGDGVGEGVERVGERGCELGGFEERFGDEGVEGCPFLSERVEGFGPVNWEWGFDDLFATGCK